MIRKEHYTLYDDYASFDPDQRVRPWRTKLVNGVHQLGRHWKGAYAYLDHDELAQIRTEGAEVSDLEDAFRSDDGNPAFQASARSDASISTSTDSINLRLSS